MQLVKPERTPERKTVDCGVAGYMCDLVGHVTDLKNETETAVWHLRRGEELILAIQISALKKSLREIKNDVEMIEHCLNYKD